MRWELACTSFCRQRWRPERLWYPCWSYYSSHQTITQWCGGGMPCLPFPWLYQHCTEFGFIFYWCVCHNVDRFADCHLWCVIDWLDTNSVCRFYVRQNKQAGLVHKGWYQARLWRGRWVSTTSDMWCAGRSCVCTDIVSVLTVNGTSCQRGGKPGKMTRRTIRRVVMSRRVVLNGCQHWQVPGSLIYIWGMQNMK